MIGLFTYAPGFAQTTRFSVFRNGTITRESSLLNYKTSHARWQSSRSGNNYYVVVQLDRVPDASLRSQLASRGIQLRQYISELYFLAIVNPGFSNKQIRELGIKDILAIPKTVKINPRLYQWVEEQKTRYDLIAVTAFGKPDADIRQAIVNTGLRIVDTKIKPAHTWYVEGPASSLQKLAELPFIISLDPIHLEDIPLNYNNHGFHSVNALSTVSGRNLFGRNLIIGIGDNANPSAHLDLQGKLILRTDEPVDYHGTHTAGTIAGGGIINPLYAGMAPRARLVVNDFSNIIVNSPIYVGDYNMPLTSNSYFNGSVGCPGEGEYNSLSAYVDSQLITYPKLLHVFAAGNDGQLTCSPYPIHFGTIKSGFQTAKDVLTVSALDYATYATSTISSRGPTTDGRIKPEVMAGGVNIISTIPVNSYSSMSGTSMACPTATGILTLLTERYKQLSGGLYPDGGLMKTIISNSATDLGNPGPDYTYGFGMINGRTAVEALEQNHYFNGTLSNGASSPFTITGVPAGAYQLKVLLYWPDVPAASFSPSSLVNDLDLTVTDPGNVKHMPMILDPTPANVTNNAVEGADHTNNIEQVLINNPSAGNYTINVQGFSIPAGPQRFYIAYEIVPFSVGVEYPYGGETWVPGETENIRWTAFGGDPNSFTLEYSTDNGSSWNLISNTVSSTARSYAWTVPNIMSHQALIRISRNGTGYTGQSHSSFTILQQPALAVSPVCPGYAQLIWNTIPGADSYQIFRFTGDSMQPIATTTDTVFIASPLKPDSSYWFSVGAVTNGYAGRRSIAQNILPNSGTCSINTLNNDLLIDSLMAPQTGRQYTRSQPGNQRISIRARNPGGLATVSPIQFSYQVNGATIVTEMLPSSLPAHSSQPFTFSSPYDFSAAGKYDIKVWVHYVLDTIPVNDTLATVIRNLRNDPLLLNPSFVEGFESATAQTYSQPRVGLDSLDRADFFSSSTNGRLNTFFNTGFSRSGNRSMLLDVTEQGTSAADSLITTFNLSGYSPTDQIWMDLYFKKQSVVPFLPGNEIWIRGNDSAVWIPVKSLSDPLDLPGVYNKLNIDVTGILASAIPSQTISSSFQVRCGSDGKTPATSSDPEALAGGGISFDDFMFTNALHDAGMRKLIQPGLTNICALGNAEKVTVLVRNFGTDTLKNIPVTYAINQDTVTEIIARILPDDSLQYSFTKTADMSVYQTYHIRTWITNPTDNYRNNDSSSGYVIQTTPMITQYPYLEGFENNNGYWYAGGQNSSWQWGKPAKRTIHKPANGVNAWVTNLTGNYNDNETSYLYSPCFDLSSLTNPVLSFSHIFHTEDECNCDFHWVEYSLNDSNWTVLGTPLTGINWYDNVANKAWQKSDTSWHVSSYDIPTHSSKVRFRFVMSSDPGTNYEGVGIDDIHVFEKASVFVDSLVATVSQSVSGNNWVDFDIGGKRVASINPNGQDLGNTSVRVYRNTLAVRDTAGQYYPGRNWVIHPEKITNAGVGVRYYFTDSEARVFKQASTCASCLPSEDPYSLGITQYSSKQITEEDSTLTNNRSGDYLYQAPQTAVQVIPNDNGYYAETTVTGFSEFWLNGGGYYTDHPLAAWLKNFTATRQGKGALIDWQTWQEYDGLKFIIQRSSDSARFSAVGQTTATGHSDSVQRYIFNDPQLVNGNNYYRIVYLKQNGDSLFSPVRNLTYSGDSLIFSVYPNPSSGNISIYTTSTCREIQIFDVLGRKVMERTGQGLVQQVSIAGLPMGVYFLKLFTDEGDKLIKLEKR